MPPKKKQETSKKADQKKKEKIIEDKTFGLKNKKGAKTQKYIQQVQHQVKYGNAPKRHQEQQTVSKKEEKKKELEELNQIFRPVASQKIDKGVDPKSVLCAFFKSGQCTKGDKCKFSHDLTVERKSEKKSLYCDTRNEDDNMENWDDDKLKEVVEKKHGEREKKLPSTEIICKYFLEAIETNKYGWFWTCPNGGDNCHYRHALPPGFVLKKDKKKEKKEDITIEELVEIERSKLGYNLTKITLESFNEWKKKKRKEKMEKDRSETDRKKAEYKAGKNIGLSGREMFTFNPDLAVDNDMDDDEAAMDIVREQDDDENGDEIKEIDIDEITMMAKESDNSGTQCSDMKRNFAQSNDADNKNENDNNIDKEQQQQQKRIINENDNNINDNDNNDDDIINEPIDESLFAEEAELLEDLENELESVKLEN